MITQVPSNNVAALKSALNVSPVLAAIRGDWEPLTLYNDGILSDVKNDCARVQIPNNLSVLITGYSKNADG